MRADIIVVLPPRLEDLPRLCKIAEPVFIQALITDFIVEAFGVAVLLRLAQCDVVPVDALL